jgi:hypothetical protein
MNSTQYGWTVTTDCGGQCHQAWWFWIGLGLVVLSGHETKKRRRARAAK